MKHLLSILALATGVTFFTTSCDSDDPEYHTLRIGVQATTDYPVVYYADQTADSLVLFSTDSWKADTKCDWIKFKETSTSKASGLLNYKYGVEYRNTRALTISINTTGEDRNTTVLVEANKHTAGMQIYQRGHLNITDPLKSAGLTTEEYDFYKKLGAGDPTTTIAFTLYSGTATITTQDSWIGVSNETFEKGNNETTLTLQVNQTGTKRTGKVTIKSTTGVNSDIYIIQEA